MPFSLTCAAYMSLTFVTPLKKVSATAWSAASAAAAVGRACRCSLTLMRGMIG